MPRNNRAGKKHQARRFLRQLYYRKDFDPAIFDEERHIDLSLAYRLIPITLKERTGYKLIPIPKDILPDLPQGDIKSVPDDPRPGYYATPRQAYLYYFYGGPNQVSKPSVKLGSVPWPRHTEDCEHIKNLVRKIVQQTEIITLE